MDRTIVNCNCTADLKTHFESKKSGRGKISLLKLHMRKREERTECNEVQKGVLSRNLKRKKRKIFIKNRQKKCPDQLAGKEIWFILREALLLVYEYFYNNVFFHQQDILKEKKKRYRDP